MINFKPTRKLPPLDPLWGALAVSTASLCGTALVVNLWRAEASDGSGYGQFALMFVGLPIYLVVFGIVWSLFLWILPKMKEPAHRAGILGAAFVVSLVVRGLPLAWEIVLAAVMGVYIARLFKRELKDEEDLKRL